MSHPASAESQAQFSMRAPLFHDFVRLNARWYPGKTAVIDEHSTLSWDALERHSNAVANGLRAAGIRNGDAVAVLLENCLEYVEILYGIWKAGAVVVPLNLAVNEAGLLNMLGDAAARALFCSNRQLRRIEASLGSLANLTHERVVTVDPDGGDPSASYAHWRSLYPSTTPDVFIGDDDPCNIIYSSGTTALPKGIKHLHRRRIQSIFELAVGHRYHYGAISICPIGLYSNIAWASLLCSLVVGGTLIVRRSFEPAQWIDDVHRFGVSHAMMVPIMFQRIIEAPNFRPDRVRSLQAVLSGGSPLFEALKRRIMENFGCAVIELYGLTEGFMTMLQPEEAEGRMASVGKPMRGHDYVLLDDNDREQPWGGTGEICVRSIHWMSEYHNRPDATRESMYFDASGVQWLRTGDIGRTDLDGFLYIVDRKKDMILSGGQNVYPADIEVVMATHPLVAEVGVIGLPDEKWGETPVAIVVPRPGAPADAALEIREWTNQRVGKQQRIREVRLVDALPRNPNGKILKRELRLSQSRVVSRSMPPTDHQ